MMKGPKGNLARAILAAVALSLGGCASMISGFQNDVINPLAGLFQNPNTQVVVADLKVAAQVVAQDTQALACVIAAGTQVAGAIESNPAFHAGASLQGTNLQINVASSAACQSLQGILAGNVTVKAGGTVLNATPAS